MLVNEEEAAAYARKPLAERMLDLLKIVEMCPDTPVEIALLAGSLVLEAEGQS